ncbi:uncharacterized protein LOC131955720 [Physella acuta]|uniref:uncharacterized protein LOC131955720 n=1 Tax=Physella acuta TaxID=109671 RepID=UPI0027DDB532|nr:uncharacterized protein LOC131955720 [Physella acuta]
MNYFGQAINVALYRNGSKVQDLSWDKAYNDDCPSKHLLQPHVRILPGDRLVTTCTFNTSGASTWRFYNQPSAEDGCSAYLTLYPREALSSSNKCDAIGSLSACDVTSGTTKIGDCHVSQFTNLTNPETIKMAAELEKSCSLNGFCRPECQEVTSRLLSHPCLRGEASKVVQYLLQQKTAGLMFVGRLHSCPMACTCTDVCPSQVYNIGNNFNDTDHNHTMHSNGVEGEEFGKNGAIVVMSDFIVLLVFLFMFIFQC